MEAEAPAVAAVPVPVAAPVPAVPPAAAAASKGTVLSNTARFRFFPSLVLVTVIILAAGGGGAVAVAVELVAAAVAAPVGGVVVGIVLVAPCCFCCSSALSSTALLAPPDAEDDSDGTKRPRPSKLASPFFFGPSLSLSSLLSSPPPSASVSAEAKTRPSPQILTWPSPPAVTNRVPAGWTSQLYTGARFNLPVVRDSNFCASSCDDDCDCGVVPVEVLPVVAVGESCGGRPGAAEEWTTHSGTAATTIPFCLSCCVGALSCFGLESSNGTAGNRRRWGALVEINEQE